MFGKLLKYEFKHSSRYVMTVYICTSAAAVLMGLGMLTKLSGLSVISSVVLVVVGVAAVIMTLVSVIKNFYDTLYARQGYLTFTLPVKSSSILFSKTLISFFWVIVSGILMVLIWLMIFANLQHQIDGGNAGMISAVKESGIMEILPSGATIVKVALFMGFSAFTNILVFVSFIFFSVTLANTRALQSHPKLFGLIIFFATYFASNTINTKLNYSVPLAFHVTSEKAFVAFKAMDTLEETLLSFGFAGTIFMVIVSVILLVLTGWIMEHKINIK